MWSVREQQERALELPQKQQAQQLWEGSTGAGAAVSGGLEVCKEACVLIHWLQMSLQKLADSHQQ